MLFNSYIFWVFLAGVVALYRLLPHRAQNRMLLVASYVFYGAWDWRFLGLIALSTVVDYFIARALGASHDPGRRRALMWTSVGVNLGILAVFKYYGFFAGELATLLNGAGLGVLLPTLDIVLPVGISFYTFQTMSYTIDVYRGQTEPAEGFLDFALYVSFFPQLVAGPIERSTRLLPQILTPRTVTRDDFCEGLYLVAIGLFKKVVIADNMAQIANAVFNTPTATLSGFEALVGVYAFAFQIYGDFSGYSAIARGVSRWLGFDLMVNFRMPYFAVSPSDFWRRWHISLSSWLRDYLYIPLGGNRSSSLMTYRNLVLTMLLGGLWHGAAWTFIAWGAVHGAILAIYRYAEHARDTPMPWADPGRSGLWRAGAILLMFHIVCVTWLLFRAESMGQAYDMFSALFTRFDPTTVGLGMLGTIMFYVTPLMAYEWWVERRGDLMELTHVAWPARAVAYTYCTLMIWLFAAPTQSEFIYFQF